MFENNMELLLRVCIFPIASLEFFQENYFKKLASMKTYNEFAKAYGRENSNSLKNALFQYASRRCRIHNFDQLELLMNKYYGFSKISGKSEYDIYAEVLNKLAKSFICHRNGRLALKYWKSEKEEEVLGPYSGINKIVLWNSLNRLMSTDIIVIQYLLQNQMEDIEYLEGFYSSIMIEDLQLEQILQKGVAETHIHQGAGISFPISWTYFMNIGWHKANSKEYLNEFFSNPYIAYNDIMPTVKVIGIVRLLLGTFLLEENRWEYGFFQYKNKLLLGESNLLEEDRGLKNLCCDWLEHIYKGELIKKEEVQEIKKVWDILVKYLLEPEFYSNTNQTNQINCNQNDIMECLFPLSIQTTGENLFLFYALKYIKGNGKRDEEFQRFFWQYIRVKNQVFEAKVQFNTIRGLDYFQTYYTRSTRIGYRNIEHWKVIMYNQLQNPHIKKLELRCSFPKVKSEQMLIGEIKKNLCYFFQAYKEVLEKNCLDSREPVLIGLIFHMIKMKDEQGMDKCWQNYFDDMPVGEKYSELYFRQNQEVYLRQIRALNEVRESIPQLDKYIIGIDAASIENNTEPWVFALAYQEARDSLTTKLSVSQKKIQTLGFTFHVGEDFRHIITGLRHIDEVLTHFGYHAGDRIGHGIALGIDVDYWIRNNPVVLLPRGEYLDNLLWIWGICKEYGNRYNIDISFLEQQILQLAEEVFQVIDGITVYILWKVYQNKFKLFMPDEKYKSSECIKTKTFCKYRPKTFSQCGECWNYETLKYVFHCKCYLEKLEEIVQIEVKSSNNKLILMLQKMLIDKISNMGIVVETNPTSNVAIGEIQDLYHHYILNLNDLKKDNSHNSVIVSINSDDPSVFNTNVSNEISYIFYVLQQKGYSREDALSWIDKIRSYGLNTSFLKDRKKNTWEMIREIDKILDSIRQ